MTRHIITPFVSALLLLLAATGCAEPERSDYVVEDNSNPDFARQTVTTYLTTRIARRPSLL